MKLLIRIIILVGFVIPCHWALGQDVLNELTVDRPGIAETPFTVLRKMYQFETGFDFNKRFDGNIFYYPNFMFRTGISKRSELRVAVKEVFDKTEKKPLKGVSPLTLGIKTHIIKQNGHIPETDILTNLVLPTSSYGQQTKKPGGEFLLLFQNDFYPNSALNYNIGFLWDSSLGKNYFTGSMCYNYLPTEKLGLFIEYYCFILPNQGWGEQGLDGGFTYLLARHIQADLSAGYSKLYGFDNWFTSLGMSFRIFHPSLEP